MKRLKEFGLRVGGGKVLLPIVFLLVAVALIAPTYASTGPKATRTRVVQVNLDQQPKISQYLDIDSTVYGYGKNACGLVAAAAAVGGENWTRLVGLIASAAGSDYQRYTGIQPSKYVAALKTVLGSDKVTEMDGGSLEQLYDELAAGNIVIVDIKVSMNTDTPSAAAPNYAHFARVLGIDVDRQELYIENTIDGAAYWTVPFADFSAAWTRPETTSSEVPDPQHAEEVTNWAVVLDGSLVIANGL